MVKNRISIIISCYNDHKYLRESVKSAFDQNYTDLEIIVVDDGSNSKTKKTIRDLNAQIDLVITQENKGVSAARNEGIRRASGEFILILDSDDYFEPNFCKKALNVFLLDKNIKLVSCYAKWFEVDGASKIFKPRGGTVLDLLFNNIAMGSSMFKKKDWGVIGGYDEAMLKGFEDWEFYIRLHKHGGKTFVIPEVLFYYRKKKISRNTIANEHKYELMEYIYLKHADLYKNNYELLLKYMLDSLEKQEKKIKKISESREYQFGKFILQAERRIKAIINRTFSDKN